MRWERISESRSERHAGLATSCHLTLDQRAILGCSPHPQGGLPGMDKFSGSLIGKRRWRTVATVHRGENATLHPALGSPWLFLSGLRNCYSKPLRLCSGSPVIHLPSPVGITAALEPCSLLADFYLVWAWEMPLFLHWFHLFRLESLELS